MNIKNTNPAFGCTETVYSVPSIEAFCDELSDNLFISPACEKVQMMLADGYEFEEGETPENDFAKKFREEFIKGLEIIN